jgi:hypothetical protein
VSTREQAEERFVSGGIVYRYDTGKKTPGTHRASNFLPEPLGASAHLQLTEVVAWARGLWLLNREGQP